VPSRTATRRAASGRDCITIRRQRRGPEAAEGAAISDTHGEVLVGDGLAGSVAIVTGAAGGLGRAIVRRLRSAGVRVVAEDIAPAVSELEADDADVAALCGDVSLASTAQAAVALALGRFGRLDVLVNNAGRFVPRSLADTTDELWDELMATNARGTFVHCRAALPALEASPAAAIVNVASISGVVGLADQVAYSATKGAVVALTRVLAVECAGRGVRVNAIAPGAISTPLLHDALAGAPDLEETLRQIAGHHPLGRIASAEEIAEVTVFLASRRASFMTGSIVLADGGYTAA
jgi:NAD(P)-dependent dehydrogenase (short-subunit alcohol dehydrogenase family)